MAETTDVRPETPTPTIEQIALQIKSLEQRTTSVTISRTASVLDLKQEIKLAFDVDSDRQRLIFQGQVLKDDKQLTDYANLDNGKVIHLVIRPIDAPHNPLNDDPNPGARHTFSRAGGAGSSGPRSRIFPSISSRLPMMEGYAFITLDSNMSDIGDSQSLLSSVLNGFAMNGNSRNSRQSSSDSSNNSNSNNTRNTPRNPFAFSFGRGTHSEFASPLAAAAASATATNNDNRGTAGLPFPPSVEVRLARTLGSMRNVRAMLDDSASNDDTRQSSTMPNSTPEQMQDIRNRLRNSGTNQSAQIGMVLNELVDLMTEAAPRMRQVAESLRQENRTPEEERNTSRRVLNMSRIVQGMSLINHFLGSVLASADIDTTTTSNNNRRHHTPNPPSSSPRRPSLVRLPSSLIYQRGNTEAIRTATPLPVRSTNNNNNSHASSGRSQLSTHTTTTAQEASSSKRKLDEATSSKQKEEEHDANKKHKGKDKKD